MKSINMVYLELYFYLSCVKKNIARKIHVNNPKYYFNTVNISLYYPYIIIEHLWCKDRYLNYGDNDFDNSEKFLVDWNNHYHYLENSLTHSNNDDHDHIQDLLENLYRDQYYIKNFLKDSYTDNQYIKDPLSQFNILELIKIVILKYSFLLTNIACFIIISMCTFSALTLSSDNYNKILSNKLGFAQESIYATIYNMVTNQINEQKGLTFFSLIFTLFVFILTSNLIGMVPYSFASTSHFIVAFSLSFTVVIGATFLGLAIHLFKFFSLLVPEGCPIALLPLLVLIEFISYLARNISLGLRLGANILSGHMLLNILSGFTYNIMKSGYFYFIISLLPLSFVMAFSGLEVGIAFIQAQVFVVLSCSYIKDGLNLH